jgi:hypothetical protein
MARDLWPALGLTAHVIQLATIDSARAAVRYILGLAKHLQLKLAVGMWTWWSERDKIREEGQRRPIYLMVKSVECYVGEITLHSKRTEGRCQENLKVAETSAPTPEN